jgi:hypothetical protein
VAAALVLNVVFLALGGICLPPVALVGKVICFRGGQNPPDPTNPSQSAPSRPDPGGF